MSLFESIWADDNSDDLLFENSPCTIEGESSAFDPGHSLEFGSHPSDGCSTKQDHVNHGPIVFDRGCVSFEDQQLAGGSSGADDMSATNNLLQQQHVEQSMSSDSGEYRDRDWVISQIERLVGDQLNAMMTKDLQMKLTIKIRANARPGKGNLTEHSTKSGLRTFNYPGNSPREAWRYTVLIRILELIHEALVNGTIVSKRDIYYRDPALFSSQSIVDRYVDDLAFSFGVPRSLLNVTAAAKGLILGSIVFNRADGTSLYAGSDREGVLITANSERDVVDFGSAKWILLVEKEATFRSLASSPFWNKLTSHGVMITAKGYPDITTRALLHFLTTPLPRNHMRTCPAYALMDFDPDGINILSTYKHGSIALPHENKYLTMESISWLGIRSKDLPKDGNAIQVQALLKLSSRDRHKASRMLERDPFMEGGKEPEWRREVQVLLMLNIKAEIQLLEAQDGGLHSWLARHLP